MRPEADAEMMQLAGFAEQGSSPEDRNLAVRFLVEPMKNEAKTKEAGRPIYDDTEMVEIRIPGDPDIRRYQVKQEHKLRFPKQYLAFRQNQNQELVTGTPLTAWPVMSRAQTEEARYMGLHSVEQLAGAGDGMVQRMGPGWQTLKQKAKDWLAAAQSGATLSKLREELSERDARIQALEDLMKILQASLNKDGIRVVEVPSPTVAARVAKSVTTTKAQPVLATSTTAEVAPKKKRGRPSKADIAARASKNGT